ncbi:MAG: hypothetical protein IJY10_04425 [Lachnospiraceae bacterium]|nr:hypothetical protein [Lachnospiraceae bacterium]
MKKKGIVVSFPGGRGSEIPLLYFGAKHFEDMGYEKVFINHPMSGECPLDILLDNALKVLDDVDWTEYEHTVFIAKSIGTLVACKVKEQLCIPASVILFTPIEDTMNYITNENDVLLVAMGDRDRYISSSLVEKHCTEHNVKCHIEPEVGHRMEVMNDLQRNLEIVKHVIGKLD